ncbi:alpha/beta hydrolase [Streptomyces luteolus]|uniref:Alpha/beta fold hydrolase n=1 Tax=Streptomyces luteolus TaxID=3043615 RepID=A0ABT6SSN0_9ACTN|nr:alpha/beta fold hydrolase [Streptomyces sp. B-S-A12]MDI3417864.1 alpha/beta fold hydrolase [Streptomyces sp. B-S-A12]
MSNGSAGRVTRTTSWRSRRAGTERADGGTLRTTLRAADGVPVDALYEPGPQGVEGPAIVLAHGFTGDLERPHVRRAAAVLARYASVVTFTFRGHGKSGGTSTVGDREVLDLTAAVSWARGLGHARVVTVGFSMGGSVVLRHAALHRAEAAAEPGEGRTDAYADAVVAVSAPARWYYRGTAPMRRLHWLVTRRSGRVVGRHVLRTRIHPREWDPVPLSPVEAVPLIAPTPLLIVHGDRDPYFPLDHPRMLADAAGGSAELWLEPGMGHAENAAGEELLVRIAGWATRFSTGCSGRDAEHGY